MTAIADAALTFLGAMSGWSMYHLYRTANALERIADALDHVAEAARK